VYWSAAGYTKSRKRRINVSLIDNSYRVSADFSSVRLRLDG